MSRSWIQVECFEKSYDGVVVAFDDIRISRGVTLLVGANGSGKSTLIKALFQLVRHQGTVRCEERLAYMPEVPALPGDVTVRMFLMALDHLDGRSGRWMELIERFALVDKLDEPIRTLSKGMRGKVNLIQCLMRDADGYVLDEPLVGLDAATVTELVDYIAACEGSFVIATHVLGPFATLDATVIRLD